MYSAKRSSNYQNIQFVIVTKKITIFATRLPYVGVWLPHLLSIKKLLLFWTLIPELCILKFRYEPYQAAYIIDIFLHLTKYKFISSQFMRRSWPRGERSIFHGSTCSSKLKIFCLIIRLFNQDWIWNNSALSYITGIIQKFNDTYVCIPTAHNNHYAYFDARIFLAIID